MQSGFNYWKRPWHRWIVWSGGILQIVALWLHIQEYRNLADVQERIFSAAEWEQIAAQQLMQCSISALMATVFFGILIIGHFSHSKRSARLADGILCVVLGLAWGVAGLLLPMRYSTGDTVLWIVILLLALGGGVGTLWWHLFRNEPSAEGQV